MSTICFSWRRVYIFLILYFVCFFFFKQKTAYEMRISDWSSDVCSSDLVGALIQLDAQSSLGEACSSKAKPPTPCRSIASSDSFWRERKIGRASCRERVCQYV